MKENSPFQVLCQETVRKSNVKAKVVPKSDLITIAGHRQERSDGAYNSGNEDEQRQLSNIINDKEVQIRERTTRSQKTILGFDNFLNFSAFSLSLVSFLLKCKTLKRQFINIFS